MCSIVCLAMECIIKGCKCSILCSYCWGVFIVWLLPYLSLILEEHMPEPVTGCLLEVLWILHWQQRPRSHCIGWDAKIKSTLTHVQVGHSISFTVTNNQAFCLKTVTVPGLVEHPKKMAKHMQHNNLQQMEENTILSNLVTLAILATYTQ